jgi:tetratricopeptide (TPR) repeat protein
VIGKTVSHYRILERIGGGGMGVVYKAEDLQLGRTVAMKFLPPELAEDEAAKERFQHEARTASALDHANICTIYEAGETEEGQLYLAMAYYEGETLKERIARGPLPVGEAVDISAQIAQGLARAHGAGIFHRDIKPANVIVNEHCEAKILDFGLAKLAEGARLTRSGTTVGTPAYMPPEQVRGEEIDGRADLWSLGVVLHEMLTGRLPFKGAAESLMIYSILHDEPEAIRGLRPDLPAPLADLVERSLVKDPEGRIQSAGEMLEVLAPLRADTPTEAFMAVETRVAAPKTTAAGSRRGLIAAVVAAVVLLAGLAVWQLRRPSPDPVTPRDTESVQPTGEIVTVLPFTFRGSSEFDYLSEGIVDLLSTKLDGAGELRTSDPHAVLSLVDREGVRASDPAAARRIAGEFGATYYVTGEILEAGGQLHVSASLYRPGESGPESTHVAEGPTGDLFGLVDEIATELLSGQMRSPSVKVFSTAALTTDSLPALRIYLRAESELRRGEFTQALASYQKTVELDPEFALAWYRLSVAAEWSTQNMLVGPAVAKAVELADRLSEHDRQLLEARLANRSGDPERAEQIYRSILGRYPEDIEAWIQLSEIQSHYGFMTGDSMVTAREALEKVTHYEPGFVGAWWHLARVAAVEEKAQEVDEIVRRILSLNPEGERALEMEALRAVIIEDEAEFASILRQLEDAEDHVVLATAWGLVMSRTDPPHGLRVLEVLTGQMRSDDARALGHEASAWLEVSQGRLDAAFEQLTRAGEILPGRRLESEPLICLIPWAGCDESRLRDLRDALETWDAAGERPSDSPSNFFSQHNDLHPLLRAYLLEMLDARLGDSSGGVGELSRLAAAAEDQPEGIPSNLGRYLQQSVRAYRAYMAGDAAAALGHLEDSRFGWAYQDAYASPYYAATFDRWLRSELLRESGRLEEALRWYSTFGEISFHDEAFVAPASLRLGQLYEERGQIDRAVPLYRRVVGLWSGADPAFAPWVEEARARLAELEAT